jgi:hypothetical protein
MLGGPNCHPPDYIAWHQSFWNALNGIRFKAFHDPVDEATLQKG